MLNNKKKSHLTGLGGNKKNQLVKDQFTFQIQKVDQTKARIKIPNKRPWAAFSGILVDRQIIILSPKNYNL